MFRYPFAVWMLLALFAGLLCSCGDDDPSADSGQAAESDGDDPGSSPGQTPDDDDDSGEPLGVFDLVVKPNPKNSLTAYVSFTTNLEATARLSIEGPDGTAHFSPRTTTPATSHTLWALGMTAETPYDIAVEAFAGDGTSIRTAPLTFTTGCLPDEFPPLDVKISDPERMAPGYTLFNIMRVAKTLDPVYGLLIAVDEKGRPVWYHEDFFLIDIFEKLADGNVFYGILHAFAKEVDMMGNLHRQWQAAELGIDSIHHELYENPAGNLYALSSEMRNIDGYLDRQGNPISYNVVGDVIAEIDPNGKRVHEYNLFDYIDPHRVREGFNEPIWVTTYGLSDNPKDWTHANAVFLDPGDGGLMVSVRHQDWILKIDPASGDLLWRLGEGGDFTMLGDGQWQYHQHSPEMPTDGRLLIFDNGNYRPTVPWWQSDYTRVVEFAIDETAMTVEQVWEYRNDETYFAPFLGSVRQMENGNILICDGGMVTNPYQAPYTRNQHEYARITEVTHEADPEKVFELVIDDPAGLEGFGYAVYRAYRLSSLYKDE